MDKLQPLIRNRFWILCGLVLPMVLFGYYAANGALKEATTARETELDSVKSGVSQGFEPNEKYATGLSVINDFYEKSIDEVIVQLWENQRERMTWPRSVADKVPEAFLGPFDLDTLITYKNQYPFVIRELMYRSEPVMPVKDAELATWKQKLILATPVPQASFGTLTPTSEEMWNAQIDVWLVDLLFDAVRRLNEDRDSIANASLRRIDRLELLGGTGSPVLTGGGGGGGGGDGAADGMAEAMPDMGGGQRGSGSIKSSVSFNPAQEFGPSQESSGGGGAGAGDAEGGMGGGVARAPKIRYLKHADSDPFLERAFYLSVIISQNKIPDFLVELVNSPWPVRIVRFHVGENPYGDRQSRVTRPGLGGGLDGDVDFGGAGPMDFDVGGFGAGSGRMTGDRDGRGGIPGLSQGLPPYALAALQHPDLVQLDLCGVITIYKQPTETIEKLAAAQSQAVPAETAPMEAADEDLPDGDVPLPSEPAPTPESAPVPVPEPSSTPPADDSPTDDTDTPPAAETDAVPAPVATDADTL